MKGEIADLTPTLLDLTLDAEEIALVKVHKDLGPQSAVARDVEKPDDAERFALTIRH